MLSYRLELPLKKYLHPVFVSVCGIVSNLVSIFKIWEKQTNTTQQRYVRVSDVKKRLALQRQQPLYRKASYLPHQGNKCVKHGGEQLDNVPSSSHPRLRHPSSNNAFRLNRNEYEMT
jgi:hypothetical protein